MIPCIDGKAWSTFQEALKSREPLGDVWGAHAFRCNRCQGYHAKANVARDWARFPLGAKSGPKPAGHTTDVED